MDQKLLIEAADILAKAEEASIDEGAALQSNAILSKVRSWNKKIVKDMKSNKSLDEKKKCIGEYRNALKAFRKEAEKIDDDTVWSYLGTLFLATKTTNIVFAIITGLGFAVGEADKYGILGSLSKGVAGGTAIGTISGNLSNAIVAIMAYIQRSRKGEKSNIRKSTIETINKLIKVCDAAMKVSEEDVKKARNQFKKAGKGVMVKAYSEEND